MHLLTLDWLKMQSLIGQFLRASFDFVWFASAQGTGATEGRIVVPLNASFEGHTMQQGQVAKVAGKRGMSVIARHGREGFSVEERPYAAEGPPPE
jgi:hypothetical protein